MAKSKSRAPAKQKTRDAVKILDKHFGTYPGEEDLDAQFEEQIDVAQALYDARTAAGLTQAKLAKRALTTQQVISQLEDADYQGHSLSMLRRIAAALNRRVEIRLVPKSRKKRVAT
jgi:ribosome-binding protein aMBF1 (putative translation factor)